MTNFELILECNRQIDINAEGAQQAEKVASHLEPIAIDDIVSSDLCRCVNTVKPILKCQEPASYSETFKLRERDMGKVQGMALAEALSTYVKAFVILAKRETLNSRNSLELVELGNNDSTLNEVPKLDGDSGCISDSSEDEEND